LQRQFERTEVLDRQNHHRLWTLDVDVGEGKFDRSTVGSNRPERNAN